VRTAGVRPALRNLHGGGKGRVGVSGMLCRSGITKESNCILSMGILIHTDTPQCVGSARRCSAALASGNRPGRGGRKHPQKACCRHGRRPVQHSQRACAEVQCSRSAAVEAQTSKEGSPQQHSSPAKANALERALRMFLRNALFGNLDHSLGAVAGMRCSRCMGMWQARAAAATELERTWLLW
jgi:hypothetical protein